MGKGRGGSAIYDLDPRAARLRRAVQPVKIQPERPGSQPCFTCDTRQQTDQLPEPRHGRRAIPAGRTLTLFNAGHGAVGEAQGAEFLAVLAIAVEFDQVSVVKHGDL